MRNILLLIGLLILSVSGIAQCKTYKLGAKGDTLNCTDKANMKQGKWVVHINELRGEPGYEEEGLFKDSKKEGVWRRYTLMGDLLAIERYRWGYKDGISQYFTLAGLLREESWKAVNPTNPYDTVEVPDPIDQYKITMKVVKVEGTTLKHGEWKYYNPETGLLEKKDTYLLDSLYDPSKKPIQMAAVDNTADSTGASKADPKKPKPKEVADFEKKNSGKKKIRVRTGSAGG